MSRETCQTTIQVDTDASHRTTQKINQYLKTFILLIAISTVLLITGCSHSDGGGGGVTDADPAGYYDAAGGSASVKQDNNMDDLIITDLQGLAYDNKIKMMSVTEGLLYDMILTSIDGEAFSGNVTIYRDGVQISTASVSGTITEGSSIAGTLTGQGPGNGTFDLTYAMSNSQPANLADLSVKTFWAENKFDISIAIGADGSVTALDAPNLAPFEQCSFDGAYTPIPNTALYSVTITFSNCNNSSVDGQYTGLAASKSDSLLVTAIALDGFAAYGELQGF